ncbi:hypothetical protein ACQUFG_16970, partial [Enterococcus gallinarum]|uniref:hypothetical protein n=1 Tax=Enterococcus gallinarum TaxID=1353 RepID=UPI003D1229DD
MRVPQTFEYLFYPESMSPQPPQDSEPPADEREPERMRVLVEAIRDESVRVAHVQASLVRLR